MLIRDTFKMSSVVAQLKRSRPDNMTSAGLKDFANSRRLSRLYEPEILISQSRCVRQFLYRAIHCHYSSTQL